MKLASLAAISMRHDSDEQTSVLVTMYERTRHQPFDVFIKREGSSQICYMQTSEFYRCSSVMSPALSKSSFFTLSRELRDEVYHHLLSSLAYDIRIGSHVVTIEYGFIAPDRTFDRIAREMTLDNKTTYVPYQAPSWLIACSQMLSEGLAQFSRQAKCTEVTHVERYRSDSDWKARLVRDSLLLPLVREMYLCVAPATHSEPYPQQSRVTCRFQVQDPHLPERADFALGYRNLLPHIRRISVEANTRFLAMSDGKEFCQPAYERLYKQIYFFPGSTYDEAHVHIQMPILPGSSQGVGRERVIHLPAFARTLPALQASMIELGKSLTATSAAFEEKQTADEKHWVVRDWIDGSTRAWHMTVKPKPSGAPSLDKLEYGGLQHFTAPDLKRTPEIVGRYPEEIVFSRDPIPRAGHSSWTCNHSGETVWLQDGTPGSESGYVREDSERLEARCEALFEELRHKQQEIAPVTEGMGQVEPRVLSPQVYHPGMAVCFMGGSRRRGPG